MSIYLPGNSIRFHQGQKVRQTLKVPIDKIGSYKSAFDMIDSDGNGSIGAEEIFQFFEDIGNGITYEQVMEIIKNTDYDGSGTLDFDEFICVMEKINLDTEIEDDEVYQAFLQFDKKKTGKLSVIEFKCIVRDIAGDVTEQEIDDFLNEANFKISDIIDYKQFLIKWRNELDF